MVVVLQFVLQEAQGVYALEAGAYFQDVHWRQSVDGFKRSLHTVPVSCCRLLALDEADRMVDGGFEEDVSRASRGNASSEDSPVIALGLMAPCL